MPGVNFKTTDGIVHAQSFPETNVNSMDSTPCGRTVITNLDYAIAVARRDEYAACTNERATCVLCLGE